MDAHAGNACCAGEEVKEGIVERLRKTPVVELARQGALIDLCRQMEKYSVEQLADSIACGAAQGCLEALGAPTEEGWIGAAQMEEGTALWIAQAVSFLERRGLLERRPGRPNEVRMRFE